MIDRRGRRCIMVCSVVWLFASCAAPVVNPAPETDHPANAEAPTRPIAMESKTLQVGRSTANIEVNTPTAEEQPARAYSCPMHPEVTSDAPGRCPKCGMALKPTKHGGKP